MTVEDVVAQDQGDRPGPDELPPDNKRLREPLRVRLHSVPEADAPPGTVAEELLEAWQIRRRRDNEDFPYARQHQGRERIVN
jgi:hypothetical protein